MATISTTLKLYDGMSAKLSHITKATDNLLISYDAVQKSSGAMIDTRPLDNTQGFITRLSEQIDSLMGSFSNDGVQVFTQGFEALSPLLDFISTKIGILITGLGLFTAGQWMMNTALFACPIFWMIAAIGLIVAAISWWTVSVGGLKTAWLIVVNAITTAFGTAVLSWMQMGTKFIIFLMKLKLAWLNIKNAIVGYVIDLYVSVVTWLEKTVNSSIDIINAFIGVLNSIQGVQINAVAKVSFAAGNALKAEAVRQASKAESENYASQIRSAQAGFSQNMSNFEASLIASKKERDTEIMVSSMGHVGNAGVFDAFNVGQQIADNTGRSASNTEKLNDQMESTNEELKYLRDLAEVEAVNRFTTAEINIEMNNENQISHDMDIDGIIDDLTEKLNEAMQATAEGVYV